MEKDGIHAGDVARHLLLVLYIKYCSFTKEGNDDGNVMKYNELFRYYI